MWSKFINKVMHIDEENTQVLDLLVTLCVRRESLTSTRLLWWLEQLTAGEAGLLMRISSSSRKQMSIERFSFFSSAFRSVWKKTAIKWTSDEVGWVKVTVVRGVETLQSLLLQRTYHSILSLRISSTEMGPSGQREGEGIYRDLHQNGIQTCSTCPLLGREAWAPVQNEHSRQYRPCTEMAGRERTKRLSPLGELGLGSRSLFNFTFPLN